MRSRCPTYLLKTIHICPSPNGAGRYGSPRADMEGTCGVCVILYLSHLWADWEDPKVKFDS